MSEQLTLDDRPQSVVVNSEEFFEWCEREKRGEVRIASLEYSKTKLYRVILIWTK